jgi:hypothetical protein
MARRQRNELSAPIGKKMAGGNEQHVDVLLINAAKTVSKAI